MEDQTLMCVEKSCGKKFSFPVHEQKFFEKQGYTPPKRCRACRQKKRQEKEAKQPQVLSKEKEWGICASCGQEQPLTEVGMCGPCTFGEADTINGNW